MSREFKKFHYLLLAGWIVASVNWTAGCTRKVPNPAPAPIAKKQPSVERPAATARSEDAAIPQAGDVVTSGKFVAAARAIEQASQDRSEKLASLFDPQRVAHRAFGNLGIDEASLQRIEQSVVNANVVRPLCEGIVDDVRTGEYRLLRVYRWQGEHSALFRLVTAEGVNYHEYFLTENAHGDVRAEDVHVLLAGERFSATLRWLCLSQQPAIHRWSSQVDENVVAQLRILNGLKQATRDEIPRDFQANFALLPTFVQRSYPVFLLQLIWANRLGDWGIHREVIDRYRGEFPQQPAAQLLSLRRLVAERSHPEARAIVDRIDKLVNADPYLDVLRGAIARDAGDFDEAERLLLKSASDPDALPDSYWELIALAIRRDQFDVAIEHLEELERRFQIGHPDLSSTAEYQPLLTSAEYQAWIARRK